MGDPRICLHHYVRGCRSVEAEPPEATVGIPYRSRSPQAQHRELKQAAESAVLRRVAARTWILRKRGGAFYRDLEQKSLRSNKIVILLLKSSTRRDSIHPCHMISSHTSTTPRFSPNAIHASRTPPIHFYSGPIALRINLRRYTACTRVRRESFQNDVLESHHIKLYLGYFPAIRCLIVSAQILVLTSLLILNHRHKVNIGQCRLPITAPE